MESIAEDRVRVQPASRADRVMRAGRNDIAINFQRPCNLPPPALAYIHLATNIPPTRNKKSKASGLGEFAAFVLLKVGWARSDKRLGLASLEPVQQSQHEGKGRP
jgi:hypothetical protein